MHDCESLIASPMRRSTLAAQAVDRCQIATVLAGKMMGARSTRAVVSAHERLATHRYC
jgi:hypothetical protein